jgi:hypothetical protein
MRPNEYFVAFNPIMSSSFALFGKIHEADTLSKCREAILWIQSTEYKRYTQEVLEDQKKLDLICDVRSSFNGLYAIQHMICSYLSEKNDFELAEKFYAIQQQRFIGVYKDLSFYLGITQFTTADTVRKIMTLNKECGLYLFNQAIRMNRHDIIAVLREFT